MKNASKNFLFTLAFFLTFLIGNAQTQGLMLREIFEGDINGWYITMPPNLPSANVWINSDCAGNGPTLPGKNSMYITRGGPALDCSEIGFKQFTYTTSNNPTETVIVYHEIAAYNVSTQINVQMDYKVMGETKRSEAVDYGQLVYSFDAKNWVPISNKFYNLKEWTVGICPLPTILCGKIFYFGVAWNCDQKNNIQPPIAIDNIIFSTTP